MMIPFDQAFAEAAGKTKYNVLTGRAPDFKEQLSSLLSRFAERYIWPVLRRISISPFELRGSETGVKILYGIFILAAIVMAGIIAYMIITKKRRTAAKNDTLRVMSFTADKDDTPESLLSDAAALAEAGRLREAVRYEFIALLMVLNARKIIILKDSKTNGQLRREVRKNAAGMAENFNTLVGTVNYIWFGHKKITPERYAENRLKVTNLINEALKNET